MDKILIAYCSPGDSDRIRIDREHRAIDDALKENRQDPTAIVRKHAATVRDVVETLNAEKFSVIQFSGHGSEDQIYFDSDASEFGESLPIAQFRQLLQSTQPNLRLIILLSCFSHTAAKILHEVAPYVISVRGEGNDSAIIDFVSVFYLYYLKSKVVDKSFSAAFSLIDDETQIVLSRRSDAVADKASTICVHALGDRYWGGIYVDLSEVEDDVRRLSIPRTNFLTILCRKIRVHENIFDRPRENAVLSIGPYIGFFSWKPDDCVKCHRILEIRDDIDGKHIEAWAEFSVEYNECVRERYRSVEDPGSPTNRKFLNRGLESFQRVYQRYFDEGRLHDCGKALIPKIFSVSKSLIKANLEVSRTKIELEEFGEVAYSLESALSAMHDVLDAIAEAMTKENESPGRA